MAITLTDAEWNKLREALETLAGFRPVKGSKLGKAVTQKELEQLSSAVDKLQTVLRGKLPDLTSGQVTAAPTAAQHNALQSDVKALHTLLGGIISAASK